MLCCVEGRATTTLGSAALCSPHRVTSRRLHQDVGKPCSDGAATKKELTCVHDIEAFLNDVTRNTAMYVSIY